MMKCGGTLNLSQFDVSYSTIIGLPCKPAQYGFPTLTALLQALPCTITIKETRKKEAVIYLNKKLAGKTIEMFNIFFLIYLYIDVIANLNVYYFLSCGRYTFANGIQADVILSRYGFQ